MLKVAESPIEIASQSFLNYWCNCLYLAFITLLTIGYGDYHPVSFLGRFVTVVMGIFGYIFFSLIITAIDSVRSFSRRERLTYLNIEEIQLKKQITVLAASVIGKLGRSYLSYKHGDSKKYHIYQRQLENELIRFKDAHAEFKQLAGFYKEAR